MQSSQELNQIFTINKSILDETQGLIVHGVNCQGVMGSGLALEIKKKYPKVFNSYIDFVRSQKYKEDLLGKINPVRVSKDLIIVNAFTQFFFGRDKNIRYVSYDAVDRCFSKIEKLNKELKMDIKFPAIGCGLGNGNWDIISSIILANINKETKKELFLYG